MIVAYAAFYEIFRIMWGINMFLSCRKFGPFKKYILLA